MSEQNKALVRGVIENLLNGDFSVLEEHPGTQEIIPFVTMMHEAADIQHYEIHELLADGDWVVIRFTTELTLKKDVMGEQAGTTMKSESIAMYQVADGVIVKQHSQGGRTDG